MQLTIAGVAQPPLSSAGFPGSGLSTSPTLIQRLESVLGVTLDTGAPSLVITKPEPRLRTFTGGHVSFEYPAAWHAYKYPDSSQSFSLITFLSNDQLHAPCVFEPRSTTCGQPIDQLARSSILVTWSSNGFPGWTLRSAHGKPLTVGGRRAKLKVTDSGCGIGANVEMDLVVADPTPHNWNELQACIRGPGPAGFERQIRAMIASTRFGS